MNEIFGQMLRRIRGMIAIGNDSLLKTLNEF